MTEENIVDAVYTGISSTFFVLIYIMVICIVYVKRG